MVAGDSGDNDCAAAFAARDSESNAIRTNARMSIIPHGKKAAKLHVDWIRPSTQLLYTVGTSNCSCGCLSVNGGFILQADQGFFLSAGFCSCCWNSSVHGGTTPFMRA